MKGNPKLPPGMRVAIIVDTETLGMLLDCATSERDKADADYANLISEAKADVERGLETASFSLRKP